MWLDWIVHGFTSPPTVISNWSVGVTHGAAQRGGREKVTESSLFCTCATAHSSSTYTTHPIIHTGTRRLYYYNAVQRVLLQQFRLSVRPSVCLSPSSKASRRATPSFQSISVKTEPRREILTASPRQPPPPNLFSPRRTTDDVPWVTGDDWQSLRHNWRCHVEQWLTATTTVIHQSLSPHVTNTQLNKIRIFSKIDCTRARAICSP